MTDAFVSRNITKSNATIGFEQSINITKSDKQNLTQKNVACNCNETIATNVNDVQCTNTPGKSINCSDGSVTNNNDLSTNKTEVTGSNDTILKYVYKQNETTDSAKTKGHYKNSLRRKRSIDSKLAQNAPLIVNYETSHAPGNDREEWVPAKQTSNVIKSADLADFNIETLHEFGKQNNDRARSATNDDEPEHNEESNGKDKRRGKQESSEEHEEINESKSHERENSNENESNTDENSRETLNQSSASNESDHTDESSTESREREKDSDDNKKNNNSKFINDRNSHENSEEIDENINSDSDEDKRSQKTKNSNSDYFSYPSIPRNKNGKIETVKDAYSKKDVEIISDIHKPRPFETKQGKISEPYENTDSSSIESNEPTHIDDGEVKPVVEINSEGDSTESNEENSSLESESLETLTGVNDDSNEKFDKLQEEKASSKPDDVKQQFERIPLNYNHQNKNQAKTNLNKETENKDDEETIDKPTPNVRYDENLNIKFDDISIKLPDIKLPEDILSYPYENPPVYRNKEKKKHGFYHYNSEEDDDEETSEKSDYKDKPTRHNSVDIEHHQDTDKNGYYRYDGNPKKQQAYKTHEKEAKEEDDDPYEKFVRERFGKRGTFEKRSEKIKDLGAYNPQLYKKVKTILDKTKNVNLEAAKSGDPKAGYMWTLEYGAKL